MLEKEAEEYNEKDLGNKYLSSVVAKDKLHAYKLGQYDGFIAGAEFGYNKAKEDARLKLKDKGIIQPLKSSILRNERLSSQEQQELCAWIECAMDFGENLDECAKELEEANKANEWHYVKDGDYPKDKKTVLALCIVGGEPYPYLAQYWKGSTTTKKNGVDLNWNCWLNNMQREVVEPYAWKEIVLPELTKEIKEK